MTASWGGLSPGSHRFSPSRLTTNSVVVCFRSRTRANTASLPSLPSSKTNMHPATERKVQMRHNDCIRSRARPSTIAADAKSETVLEGPIAERTHTNDRFSSRSVRSLRINATRPAPWSGHESARLALDDVDRMIGRYEPVTRQSAPRRQIDGRSRVAGNHLEAIADLQFADSAPELDNELAATDFPGIPTFFHARRSESLLRDRSLAPRSSTLRTSFDSRAIQATRRSRVKAASRESFCRPRSGQSRVAPQCSLASRSRDYH